MQLKSNITFLSIFFSAVLSVSNCAAAPSYWIEDIGDLGGNQSMATSLSEDGSVVGLSTLDGTGESVQGFVWSKLSGILPLASDQDFPISFPTGISRDGTIVGYITTGLADTSPSRPAKFLATGALNLLPIAAGYSSGGAFAINGAGRIVGALGTIGNLSQSASIVKWSRDLPTIFGQGAAFAINSLNDFGGIVFSNGIEKAFIQKGSIFENLGTLGAPYNYSSRLLALNDCGDSVGFSTSTLGESRGFQKMSKGPMIQSGAADLVAYDINNKREIVGIMAGANEVSTFLKDSLGHRYDLKQLISNIDDWSSLIGVNINDAGMISGYGFRPRKISSNVTILDRRAFIAYPSVGLKQNYASCTLADQTDQTVRLTESGM